jgi:hypothetical protein
MKKKALLSVCLCMLLSVGAFAKSTKTKKVVKKKATVAKVVDGTCVSVMYSCGIGGAVCGKDTQDIVNTIKEGNIVYCGSQI